MDKSLSSAMYNGPRYRIIKQTPYRSDWHAKTLYSTIAEARMEVTLLALRVRDNEQVLIFDIYKGCYV